MRYDTRTKVGSEKWKATGSKNYGSKMMGQRVTEGEKKKWTSLADLCHKRKNIYRLRYTELYIIRDGFSITTTSK